MEFLHVPLHIKSVSDTLSLIPFGCVHSDDEGFRKEMFQECLHEIKTRPNTWGIGMGDYRNFLRTRARNHIRKYVEDRNSFRELDKMVRDSVQDFVEDYLMPVRDRLLGLSEGNHYYEFDEGETDTQMMCRLLKIPYLDKPCFARLNISIGKEVASRKTLKLLVHHGDWGGGSGSHSGDVGSAERKVHSGFNRFDIVFLGHTHRKWFMNMPELDLTDVGELRCIERPRCIVRTGCFVASYDKCTKGPGRNYAQAALMPPAELGYVRLDIQLYRKHGDPLIYHRFKGYV